MLSIHTISGSKGYYDADNYYAEGETEAGFWHGKGATKLNLVGNVNIDKFEQATKGELGGIKLGRMNKKGVLEHNPGLDLTFNAPKSLSVLALLDGGDKKLVEAHDQAVNEALNYIERRLIGSRFRRGTEVVFNQTRNMVCAKFRHDISRDKDPNLHTHATILNATFGPTDVLRSIDQPILFQNKMLVGAVYQSKLAVLCQEIGYQTNIRKDGTFEIVSLNEDLQTKFKNLQDDFSKRRNAILADMKDKGSAGAVAAQASALSTRRAKETLTIEAKKQLWSESIGVDLEIITNIINNAQEIGTIKLGADEQTKNATQAVESAMRHLIEHEAVAKARDFIREAIIASLGDATPEAIYDAMNKKIRDGELMSAKIIELVKVGDKIVPTEMRAYTTPAMVEKEKLTLKIMREERGRVKPIINSGVIEFVRQDVFTKGQMNAAKAILKTKDRFIVVQGYAGTGKTFMLTEVKEIAEKQGYEVLGMAPSSSASNLLEKETGISSKTVQKTLAEGLTEFYRKKEELKAPEKQTKTSKPQLWVVDESSFISTGQALALTKLATKRGAHVVLLGDSKQLGAVEAGKPFALSQKKKYGLTTVSMKEILRQENLNLKKAVYAATKGDIKKAFDSIKSSVIEVKSKTGGDRPIERKKLIAEAYLSMTEKEREKTLVISPANKDRTKINNLIREGLKKQNVLTGESITTTCLVNSTLTKEARTKTFNYNVGNVVRFGSAYKKLGIKKDDYLTVTSVDHNNKKIHLSNQDNKIIEWSPKGNIELFETKEIELNKGDTFFWRRAGANYDGSARNTNEKFKIIGVNTNKNSVVFVDLKTGEEINMRLDNNTNKHFDHAYCMTAHQAQGVTSETTFVNLESQRKKLTNQQTFYVTLSRAKKETIIFTDDKAAILNQLTTHLGEKQSAFEQITDPRAKNTSDIYRSQQGLKTQSEIQKEKNQELIKQTNEYISNLTPVEMQKIEDKYRSTQSKTILNFYDQSGKEATKNNYQRQIDLFVRTAIIENAQQLEAQIQPNKGQNIQPNKGSQPRR